ncbi:hypothetical protein NDU88_005753 [Pleurodeles waltl]|uniref:Uncharacterized protein n=1 Tax=Pleurodeles waltl TaxID=8319 RepID=A0AAV7WBF5_PLEWA|nr:hypothetical protein NDU88_005753 [Pleurodeles waltl]
MASLSEAYMIQSSACAALSPLSSIWQSVPPANEGLVFSISPLPQTANEREFCEVDMYQFECQKEMRGMCGNLVEARVSTIDRKCKLWSTVLYRRQDSGMEQEYPHLTSDLQDLRPIAILRCPNHFKQRWQPVRCALPWCRLNRSPVPPQITIRQG